MSLITNTTQKPKGGWWALSPLVVFLCLYLVTSLLVNDFYKVPITVAFLVSSCYAIAITRGLNLEQRVYQFSVGASKMCIRDRCQPDDCLQYDDGWPGHAVLHSGGNRPLYRALYQ